MVNYLRWPIYVFNSVVNTKLPYQQLVLFLRTKNSLVSSVFFPLLSLRTIEHDKSTEQTQATQTQKENREVAKFLSPREKQNVLRGWIFCRRLITTMYRQVPFQIITTNLDKIKTIWIFNFSYRPEPSIYACLTVERTPRKKTAYYHRPERNHLKKFFFYSQVFQVLCK